MAVFKRTFEELFLKSVVSAACHRQSVVPSLTTAVFHQQQHRKFLSKTPPSKPSPSKPSPTNKPAKPAIGGKSPAQLPQKPASLAHLRVARPSDGVSYIHNASNVPLKIDTLGSALTRKSRSDEYADKEACFFMHQDIRRTYSQLYKDVNQVAKGLIGMGFKPHDRIGLWGPNNYEWFISFLAIARIGAITVCINPGFKEHELEYCLNQVGTCGLLAARAFRTLEYYPILHRVFPGIDTHCSAQPIESTHVPSIRHIITMERIRPNAANKQHSGQPGYTSTTANPAGMPFSNVDDRPRGIVPFDDMLERGSTVTNEKLDKFANNVSFDSILNVQFTSGTTGFPKAVTQSHFNVVNNATCGVDRFISGGDTEARICSSLPFFHSFSLTTVVTSCIVNGKFFVTPNEFYDAKSVLTAIELEKCNNIFCVPTMIFDLLHSKELMKHDLSSLRGTTIGGAPCPAPLAEMWFKRTGTNGMVIGYGMTETGPVITSGFADDTPEQRYGTVGYPFPHTEVKIANTYDGRPVPLGEKGEICTRGYHVMNGYWGDEAKTKETITPDRWLKTGDLGSMTSDGYVKIEGRIKEMIKRGGENVFPAELESILLQHDAIKECYVVGVPDERLGEEICAVVRVKEDTIEEGFDLEDDLRDFFLSTAASFKVPKYYWILADDDKLPMTMSGKVQKLKLKEMASAKFGPQKPSGVVKK